MTDTIMYDARPPDVRIVTFGILHGPPPAAPWALTLDLTNVLRNPHDDPAMRYETGQHPAVREHVLATPGAFDIIDGAVALAMLLHHGYTTHRGEPLILQVYCRGGRHRSVAIGEAIALELEGRLLAVEVVHRDITKPVIQP